MEKLIGPKSRAKLNAVLGEVWERWRNNYRYVPEDRLRKEFQQRKLDRGIKGVFLKENARVTLENAITIVNQGAIKWKKS